MERIYSTLLVAYCGLMVIVFGLVAVIVNCHPHTNYAGQIHGGTLIFFGLAIIVFSGMFDKPKKNERN